MYHMLKTEKEKCSSARQEHQANQRESVETNAEGLTQERAYKQRLQMCIKQNNPKVPGEENVYNLLHDEKEEEEDEEANDTENKDLQIYDSLEVEAHPCYKRNRSPLQTDMTTRKAGREVEGKPVSDNAYPELCYDPKWKSNLTGGGSLNENPQITMEEYYIVPKEKESQLCVDRLQLKGEHITDTDSAPLVPTHVSGDDFDQLCHPHQSSPSSSHNNSVQRRSSGADFPRPTDIFSENQSDMTSQTEFGEKSECDHDIVAENIPSAPEHAIHKPESDTHHQPGVTANKKLERQEDIVERNKITLGRSTCRGGSYATMYACKQGTSHNVNKVTQICKEKKAQRKETPNLSLQKEQPPALGVKAEQGDCLNPPLERPAAVSQPKAQKTTSLQSLPPTCHLNVNTSAHLLPVVERRAQDAVISKVSLPACAYLGPGSGTDPALSSAYQETNPERSTHVPQQGAVAQVSQINRETNPVHWQRTAAAKWVLPCEADDHKLISDEFQCMPSPQSLPRTPPSTTTSLSLGSDIYAVLPPVGRPLTGEESELSPGRSVNTADTIHRSGSDSYLGQMGKQKQLGVNYKAYSLKDYNQLQLNVTLRGLGPDYKAVEEAAEKMRRQRLYSNVIREQNKKISRIPFLPAKNPQGADKKVPRMKALEYAKTIVKPSAQSQLKQRQKDQTTGFNEHAPLIKGLDMLQPDTLAVLLKRHEEEKKAAAQRVHAV